MDEKSRVKIVGFLFCFNDILTTQRVKMLIAGFFSAIQNNKKKIAHFTKA